MRPYGLRPISVLRLLGIIIIIIIIIFIFIFIIIIIISRRKQIWSLQRVRLKQNLNSNGWNSHVHGGLPGNVGSTNLRRDKS